jgi:Zn-dependent oligopeptidase
MEYIFKKNYSVKEIKNIERNIKKTFSKWLLHIKLQKNINPDTFLESYLYNLEKFNYITGIINFLKEVSPYKKIRNASLLFQLNIEKYFLDFYKNPENYKLFMILKTIKNSNSYNNINNKEKLIKIILKPFEDNKKSLSKINKKIFELENKFDNFISNDTRKIIFNHNELLGIKENILKSHKIPNHPNKYLFDTSYPDYDIIISYCSNQNTRKKMFKTFYNIAPKNIDILYDLLKLRYKRAKLLGFNDSNSHSLSYNRIATLPKINKLINRLTPILKRKSKKELKQLLPNNMSNTKLYEYDIAYYSTEYKKKYLNIDDNLIKEYFPSNYAITQIFSIYSELFGFKIKPYKNNKNFYVIRDNKANKYSKSPILGYLYLDLYPRPGKFSHAATIDIQNTYINNKNKRIIPLTAIVCNFTPHEKDKSYSLLTFSEIITFFHEFGHAVHFLLSNVKYELLSGFNCEDDFVEMISQFFENWCYNKDFLRKISKHYLTHKPLDDIIINKIIQNRNYNCGLKYLHQLLYLEYDLKIHSLKNPTKKLLHKIWFDLAKKLFPTIILEKDTIPMCRFGHLVGYNSGYYGYLWSNIYAHDVFSEFEKHGVFNKKLGLKFRKTILERGGTVKGTEMLNDFLQRPSSLKPFIHIFKI